MIQIKKHSGHVCQTTAAKVAIASTFSRDFYQCHKRGTHRPKLIRVFDGREPVAPSGWYIVPVI